MLNRELAELLKQWAVELLNSIADDLLSGEANCVRQQLDSWLVDLLLRQLRLSASNSPPAADLL